MLIPPLTLPSTSPNAKTKERLLYIFCFYDNTLGRLGGGDTTYGATALLTISTAFERLFNGLFSYTLIPFADGQEPRGIAFLCIYFAISKTYIKFYTSSTSSQLVVASKLTHKCNDIGSLSTPTLLLLRLSHFEQVKIET